nr:MAG TPA: Serine/Threonine Kinase [Bacteriophage sp.]
MVGGFERPTSSLEIDCTISELVKVLDSAGVAHGDIETSK